MRDDVLPNEHLTKQIASAKPRLYVKHAENYEDIDKDKIVCLDCDWSIDVDSDDINFHPDDDCPNDLRSLKRTLILYIESEGEVDMEQINEEFIGEYLLRDVIKALSELFQEGSIYEPIHGEIRFI